MYTQDSKDLLSEDFLIAKVKRILGLRMRIVGPQMSNPTDLKDYLALEFASLEHEEFGVMFLDTHMKLIRFEKMFRGTVDEVAVSPREIAVRALKHNATFVVLAHNHPSGDVQPGKFDIKLTKAIEDALELLSVTVIDHIIVSGTLSYSFVEGGLL